MSIVNIVILFGAAIYTAALIFVWAALLLGFYREIRNCCRRLC